MQWGLIEPNRTRTLSDWITATKLPNSTCCTDLDVRNNLLFVLPIHHTHSITVLLVNDTVLNVTPRISGGRFLLSPDYFPKLGMWLALSLVTSGTPWSILDLRTKQCSQNLCRRTFLVWIYCYYGLLINCVFTLLSALRWMNRH